MHIERYVTEWGFPALAWHDRINSTEMPRRLWINFDGEQVVTLHRGQTGGVGRWHQWDGLSMNSSAGNSTLTASFTDGRVIPIAISAVPPGEMEELRRAIHQRFLQPRANYKAPQDGPCWSTHFTGTHVPLEASEESFTRTDVPEADCQMLKFVSEFPTPSIMWKEPLRTIGLATRYHLVQRILFIGRGVRQDCRHFSFHSYKPGTEGVIELHADFSFLKGFRVVDSSKTNALDLQPLKNTMPGLSIVADFRYGLTLPLTCAYVPNDDARLNIHLFAERLQDSFMPLVGKRLTDEELGFPPKT